MSAISTNSTILLAVGYKLNCLSYALRYEEGSEVIREYSTNWSTFVEHTLVSVYDANVKGKKNMMRRRCRLINERFDSFEIYINTCLYCLSQTFMIAFLDFFLEISLNQCITCLCQLYSYFPSLSLFFKLHLEHWSPFDTPALQFVVLFIANPHYRYRKTHRQPMTWALHKTNQTSAVDEVLLIQTERCIALFPILTIPERSFCIQQNSSTKTWTTALLPSPPTACGRSAVRWWRRRYIIQWAFVVLW